MQEVATEFKLNKEQLRAFRLIANHSSCVAAEQLKMHLGGMGGTGKSQVIRALISMFDKKQESHHFVVLAPTGTAAALLNGSTYHSMLGVRSRGKRNEDSFEKSMTTLVNDARSRLAGVDYIFIDEISMIACHELYAISSRLAAISNVHDKPYGGFNIILAGDFAQLPPTSGAALYSNNVSKVRNTSMSPREQENTIGKILWNQITTVVILKENMRQKSQSQADKKLRVALENMHYKDCTENDIEFLRTRIAGTMEPAPQLNDPKFRNVSIITARNIHKDKLNMLGSQHFAADSGQELTHFYSVDQLNSVGTSNQSKKTKAMGKKKK